MPTQSDDPLPSALARWRVKPRRNPNFRAAVWARLDGARRPSPWTRFARAHPTLVTGALTAAILLGAWSGRSEARERAEMDRSIIATNYVHALDARWMRQR